MAQAKRMAEFVYGDPAEVHHPCPATSLIRSIVDVPGIRIVEVNIRLDRSSALRPAIFHGQGIFTKGLATHITHKSHSILRISDAGSSWQAVTRTLECVAPYLEFENSRSIPARHRLLECRIPQTIGPGYVHVKGRRRGRPCEVEEDVGIDRCRKGDGQARHQAYPEYGRSPQGSWLEY